jgi:drug/metabolite transporter (DMT)-like permease
METLKKNQSFGILLVLLSGLFYGTNPALSKLHFQFQGDTLSFLFVRFFIASFLLGALWFWKRPKTRPNFNQVLISFLLGAMIFAISFLYIAAIQFISAGIATLLLFTFPFWIVILAVLTKEEPIDKVKIICLVVAFNGLMLTIGAEFKSHAWEGLLLGLAAGITLALNVFYGNRMTKHIEGQTLSLLMMLSCALICFPMMLIDTPEFPTSLLGWGNVIIAAIFFSGGILCFFVGLPLLGPIKASLYNNIEPVFSIFLAYLLLGEKMTILQYIGAALVVVAIFAVQMSKSKKI